MNNKFSIIIPFFNGMNYIEETLRSIVDQSHQYYEVIIIDDNSKLSESKLLSDLVISGFPNFKIIRNKNNIGMMRSLNIGVSSSKSDYVIILGQDDLIEKNHLESINIKINSYGDCFSAIFCDAKYIARDTKTEQKVRGRKLKRYSEFVIFSDLFKWNVIVSTGICINKSLLLECDGFNTKYKNYGEWLTWLKLSLEKPMLLNKNTFSFYRRHDNNITNTMFGSGFFNTYNYYTYVNQYAYSISNKKLKYKIIFTKNNIKNIILLAYKTIIKQSYSHKKVFKK